MFLSFSLSSCAGGRLNTFLPPSGDTAPAKPAKALWCASWTPQGPPLLILLFPLPFIPKYTAATYCTQLQYTSTSTCSANERVRSIDAIIAAHYQYPGGLFCPLVFVYRRR